MADGVPPTPSNGGRQTRSITHLSSASEPPPLSRHEKQILKDNIFKLTPERLGLIVDIIAENMPGYQNEEEEIEIDIDLLDNKTLLKLQQYVNTSLEEMGIPVLPPPPPPPAPAPISTSVSESAHSPPANTTTTTTTTTHVLPIATEHHVAPSSSTIIDSSNNQTQIV